MCLLLDLYSYKYNDSIFIAPSSDVGAIPPLFSCTTNAKTPLPNRNVRVLWRAGLDLEPIDLHNHDGVAWLESLIWPGENDRLNLLRQAIEVARNALPLVAKGDLRVHLPELAAQAPSQAHSLYFTAPSSPILKLLLNVAHWRMSSLVHARSGSATRFPPFALVRISAQMDFVRPVSFYSRRTRCQSPVSTRMAGLHSGFEPIGFVDFSKLAQCETSPSFYPSGLT